MNPHEQVVKLLDQLRDCARGLPAKTRDDFNSATDSIETITRGYMVPELRHDWSAYQLTRTEIQVADFLLLRKGKVCSKEQLLDALYGNRADDPPDAKIIDVFVCKMRKKLIHFGSPYGVETVWGAGYKLVESEACSFETRSDAPYIEVAQPPSTDTDWDGMTVPAWGVPVLNMLSASRTPITAEALSVAAGRSVSDFANRLRDLRAAVASKYQIFNLRGAGYTMHRLPSALQSLKVA